MSFNLLSLSLNTFLTSLPAMEKASKESLKEKIPPDIQHLICKEITEKRRELAKYLVLFSDFDTVAACPIKEILDSNPDLAPLEIVEIFLKVFPNLKTLDFSGIWTKVELGGQLNFTKERCPHLKNINLSHTEIASLEGLPSQLEELNFYRSIIPEEEFLKIKDRCPQLKKINLTCSNIAGLERLPSQLLEGLPSQLEELDFNGSNNIIPKEEFLTIKERFPNLKKIYLDNTKIVGLEEGLPSQLEELAVRSGFCFIAYCFFRV